ncbi:MAG: hypothetical protein AAB409_04175, partial [Gemmatimonadota bacterium]
VVVTVRGQPVAEIRPVPVVDGGLAARWANLVERGVVTRRERSTPRLRPIARRPGALSRFLQDRDA